MKKVSVIIPVYNVGQYLKECLDSVFSQDIDSFEVICINDGSTDNSQEILNEYENRYSNLLLINISNHGVGNARNLGIRLADSITCCFMDPDDYYPDKTVLSELYQNLITHNVNISGGSAYLLRNGEVTCPEDKDLPYLFNKDEIMNYSNYQWSYGFWRFMYRTDFLKEKKIIFPNYSRFQDPPFLVRTMIEANNFYASKKLSYIYRVNSKERVYTYEKTRDCLQGMTDVLQMSYKNNLKELNAGTVEHINTWLCFHIYKYIIEGKIEVIDLLNRARKYILENNTESFYEFEAEKRLKHYKRAKENEKRLLEEINHNKNLILYGAGFVGKKVADYLIEKGVKPKIFFGVTRISDKSDNVYKNISLWEIKDLSKLKDSTLVLITTRENLQEELVQYAKECGFENIVKLNCLEFEVCSLKKL